MLMFLGAVLALFLLFCIVGLLAENCRLLGTITEQQRPVHFLKGEEVASDASPLEEYFQDGNEGRFPAPVVADWRSRAGHINALQETQRDPHSTQLSIAAREV